MFLERVIDETLQMLSLPRWILQLYMVEIPHRLTKVKQYGPLPALEWMTIQALMWGLVQCRPSTVKLYILKRL